MVGSESPINKQIEHFVESSVWTTAGSGTWDETQSAKSPKASARNRQGQAPRKVRSALPRWRLHKILS